MDDKGLDWVLDETKELTEDDWQTIMRKGGRSTAINILATLRELRQLRDEVRRLRAVMLAADRVWMAWKVGALVISQENTSTAEALETIAYVKAMRAAIEAAPKGEEAIG